MAHDLRGPLQTLTLLIDPHADLMGGEDAVRIRAAVTAAVQGLTDSVSRFSLAYAPLETEPLPLILSEVVNQVVELQRYQRGLPAVELLLRVPADLPAVRGIEAHLRHLLLSLIINAKQALAGRSDGEVELAATAQGETVELTVEDNGPGLAPEERLRAFELFHTTHPGHMGLGLPVARWLAERQGATVSLETGRHGGLRAVVRLAVWQRGG
jgi:signal transduction histidine kinase